jgi:hypothetical protein
MKHGETNQRVSSSHYNRQEPRCVPSLHRAGNKQGNLGRPLFFEIEEQRDERHNIKTRCRLKQNWLRRPALRSEQWGSYQTLSTPNHPKRYTQVHISPATITTESNHKTTHRENGLYISIHPRASADPPSMDSTERVFAYVCGRPTT